jgi:hypothetical protein
MFTKFSISIVAALALSAATGGVARADPDQSSSNETSARPHSPTNDEIDAAETDNPASVDYENREIDPHSPTNKEIDSAETGNPASLDYRNRHITSGRDPNAEWQELDSGSPDSVQPEP